MADDVFSEIANHEAAAAQASERISQATAHADLIATHWLPFACVAFLLVAVMTLAAIMLHARRS